MKLNQGVLVAVFLIAAAPGCSQLARIEDKVDEVSTQSHGFADQQKKNAQDLDEVRKALDSEGITSDEKRAEMLSGFKNMERSLEQLEARVEEQNDLLLRIQAHLDLLSRSSTVVAIPGMAAAASDSNAVVEGSPGPGASDATGQSEEVARAATGAGAGAATGTAPGAATGMAAGSLAQSGSPGAEVYDAAFRDFTRGSYTLARDGFEEFLAHYPGSDLADNARYWIGESWYAQGNYREAVGEFEGVLRSYPESDILPSALLKASNCHLELGETDRAVEGYRRLLKEWSESDESFIAKQKLAEIGSAP